MSAWRHYLYDAHETDAGGSTADLIGEIRQAKDRTLNQGIRQMATAGLTVDRDHSLVGELFKCHRRLLVIRDGDPTADPADPPMFVGPVITCEEAGDKVAITAADAWWRLIKRRIGIWAADLNAAATDGPAFRGTTLIAGGPYKKSWLIRLVIHNVNEYYTPVTGDGVLDVAPGTLAGSFCGLAPPLVGPGGLAGEGSGFVGPFVHKPASDAIQEISGNLDAPEWIILPEGLPRLYDPAGTDSADLIFTGVDPTPTMHLGRLNVAMAIGGQVRDEAQFHMGYGRRNVTDYKRVASSDGVMNWGAILPTDSTVAVARQDLTDTPTNPVIYMDEVSSDLVIPAMRDLLVQEHVAIRRIPRETITFNPLTNLTGRVPVLGTDYDLGDIVPFRAVRRGVTQVNAYMRVYGVNRALSDDGDETAAPVLVPS